jgi:hypothetical protein
MNNIQVIDTKRSESAQLSRARTGINARGDRIDKHGSLESSDVSGLHGVVPGKLGHSLGTCMIEVRAEMEGE